MDKNYSETIKKIELINKYDESVNIMEVCGTHTNAIGKFGLRALLNPLGLQNPKINLISGPGCPVCVTPDIYIDYIYELALKPNIIVATYGDMFRVPGSSPKITLENAKALGAEVKMIYSSIDAVEIAKKNPDKKIVFMGIGFETTAPATAVAVMEAEKNNLNNFYVLSLHKIVEPVIRALLQDQELKIQGFILPGHVAVIIGETGFKFLEDYNCPAVIAGFEIEEIVDAILALMISIKAKDKRLLNTYKSLVRIDGNEAAINLINKVFDKKDDIWRGIGLVPLSGYGLKKEYARFDIEKIFPLELKGIKNSICMCGDVLKGKIKPNECVMFGKDCLPESPIGPCMVSSEGSCSSYYRYREGEII